MSTEMNPWKTLSSERVYDNPWIEVVEHQVLNPAGKQGIYGTVHFKNLAVGVLPLDEHLNTWLVGQYRFPLRQYSWEIPEGGGMLEVDPLETAKRELKEETGFSAKLWKPVLRMHLSNSVTDELAIAFVATDLTAGESQPEEDELLHVRKLPFEEVYQMVCRAEITDAISVAMIYKVKLLLLEGKLL